MNYPDNYILATAEFKEQHPDVPKGTLAEYDGEWANPAETRWCRLVRYCIPVDCDTSQLPLTPFGLLVDGLKYRARVELKNGNLQLFASDGWVEAAIVVDSLTYRIDPEILAERGIKKISVRSVHPSKLMYFHQRCQALGWETISIDIVRES